MSTVNSEIGAIVNCDVLVVGAGFSGIATLYRMRKLGLDTKVFETGSDFGGVWYWNRYPGARVDSEWPYYQLDIPEVYKTYSFPERFPDHKQIRHYMAHVDKVLNLRKDVQFDAHVNNCHWDEKESKWTVKTRQGHVAKCKYLVLCTGLLHRRHLPDFPGITDYKGVLHHTGFWPEDMSTKGKRVGLIGAGATAVQVTQEVAKEADHLTIFMRRPSYCLPMGQRPMSELENRAFHTFYDTLFKAGRKSRAGFPMQTISTKVFDVPEAEREAWWNDAWSRGGFQFMMSQYADCMVDAEANKEVYKFWAKKIRERMRPGKKRDLMAPLVDNMPYYFGTKRTPLEQDYYEMVDKDSVDVVNLNDTPIKTFTEKGIKFEDGTEEEFDVIVLATGFDSFSGAITQMGFKNKHGVDIKDVWNDGGISTYLGMTLKDFPNAFMLYTPHAPTALSNGPTIIESQADFVTSAISLLESSNARSIEPQAAAEREWCEFIDVSARQTLFPLTNSWWTGGNIPGKKVQMLTYVMGIEMYETQCRDKLVGWKGFDVVYNEGGNMGEEKVEGVPLVDGVGA